MMTLILALAHATATHAARPTIGVDSIVIERLTASRPRYIPLIKRNTITPSQGVVWQLMRPNARPPGR
jgi:hypothetical protein